MSLQRFNPLRALFVSASIGSGHHQAQRAVQQALRQRNITLEELDSDVVAYLNAAERKWTVDLYALELRYFPWLYEWFYHATDHDRPFSLIEFFCRFMGLRGMTGDLRRTHPEVVVHSYWSSVPLAQTAQQRTGQHFVNALIVTDYRAHRHWIRPEADLTLVATAETREQMIKRGLPAEKIVITGIPIASRYKALIGANKAALRQKYGLHPDWPLLLISGGGTGSYRALDRVLDELGNLGRRVQVLILAGAKESSVEQLGGATLHRLGYTTDFPELLAASDLVVGKAGGLTVAEATTLGIPMIIYEPIPGQEEYNADFLVRRGAGLWVKQLSELRSAIWQTLEPKQYAALSAAAQEISSPDAADLVATALLQHLERL